MDFNNKEILIEAGYGGLKSIKDLWFNRTVIPIVKGVYLVINPAFQQTEFINPGVGGFFKGKDPNISISELEKNHIDDSQVVYIGKAGSPTNKATLNSRIGQYLRFGLGKNVGHWGGRLIWQLKNYENLIFCWKPTPNTDPKIIKKQLLNELINQFGARPFANLTG